MAANSAANTTAMPVKSAFTVFATVLATAVPTMKTAAKLKNAENQTAHFAGLRGDHRYTDSRRRDRKRLVKSSSQGQSGYQLPPRRSA